MQPTDHSTTLSGIPACSGSAHSGPAHNGSARDRAVHGRAGHGTDSRGTVDRGTVDRGTVDQGTVDQGTVDQGIVNRGTVDPGTVDREKIAGNITPLSSHVQLVSSALDQNREIPDALRSVINRRDTWMGFSSCPAGAGSAGARSGKQQAANSDMHYHEHLPTGFGALDARLCEQGWPLGTSIEVLSDAHGMGAMGLFLPAMESLNRQQRWQAFIAPPYTPYAPLLAARGIDTQQVLLIHPRDREELLWSTEQALRSGTCSAVFSWLGNGEYRYAELRRLQLAAARGNTLAVLFRPQEAAHQHAPASLRLQMKAYREVHILKQRSGMQGIDVYLPPEDDIPHQPQLWELPRDPLHSSRLAL